MSNKIEYILLIEINIRDQDIGDVNLTEIGIKRIPIYMFVTTKK